MKDTVVIVNNQAGKLWGKAPSIAEELAELEKPFTVIKPASKEAFEQQLVEWQTNPPKRIIIAGGDGTISSVWKALLGKDVRYGIIPMGSINNIARRLEIPFDTKEAIGVINNGSVARIDAGKANNEAFFESAGTGLMANIMAQLVRENTDKEVLKIARATIDQIMTQEPLNAVVSVDGERRVVHTPWITVSNLGTIGAALVDPNASGENRELSLVYCKELSASEMALAAVQFLRQQHLEGDYFEFMTGSEVTIETTKPMAFHLDELIITTNKLNLEVLPGVIEVMCPAKEH